MLPSSSPSSPPQKPLSLVTIQRCVDVALERPDDAQLAQKVLEKISRHIARTVDLVDTLLLNGEDEANQRRDLSRLAIEQWHRIIELESDKRQLQSQLSELQNQPSKTTSDTQGELLYSELAALRMELDATAQGAAHAEAQKNCALQEISVLEASLVQCKLKLAQQEDYNALAHKLLSYYIKHLEICDPDFIIPLHDREKIESLQLGEIDRDVFGPPRQRYITLPDQSAGNNKQHKRNSTGSFKQAFAFWKTLSESPKGITPNSGRKQVDAVTPLSEPLAITAPSFSNQSQQITGRQQSTDRQQSRRLMDAVTEEKCDGDVNDL